MDNYNKNLKNMISIRSKSNNFIYKIFVTFTVISMISRLILYCYSFYNNDIDFSISVIAKVIIIGFIKDILTFVYFLPLCYLIRTLYPKFLYKKNISVYLIYLLYFLYIFALLFNLISEFFFWEEFGSRYNFIAVDYLIYTNEVIGNIFESYNIIPIIISIFVISLIWILIDYRFIKIVINEKNNHISKFTISLLLSIFIFNFWNDNYIEFNNRFHNEISKNGIYNLFSAFRNNRLNYQEFYPTIDNVSAFKCLRKILSADGRLLFNEKSIEREIKYEGLPNKYNVILISVESLSAEFISIFGNKNNITPNIDKIIDKSMLFTNYFATGTRTVRGLEAMTLSVPPTPGSSIIRRPYNENLFSIATILKDNDYDVKFIYGGFGYFDNMNYFFANNEFDVIDRSNIDKKDIIFANIWGVADEVLFDKAIKEADNSYDKKQSFFSLIMTTSNHRPYTYPENRIDIPSRIGRRNGAVKYTDYAIGKFIKDAKSKEWFKNTIFIITADHCASSSGKSDIPISKYHIPLLVYAPGIIKPQINDSLASQIDLAPTILGLLNISYNSKFFGSDMINHPKHRAFLSTYQVISLLKDNKLIKVSPNQDVIIKDIDEDKIIKDLELTKEFISYYQIADYLFVNKLMKSN